MDKYSYLSNSDGAAVDALYQQYLQNPESVEYGWQKFFEGFEFSKTNFEEGATPAEELPKEFKVINLINGYRSRGHLFTKTNPVRERRKYEPTLAIENFGLEASDLNQVFQAGTEIGIGPATLADIIKHLETTYCQSIGVEYMYMRKPEKIKWLRTKLHENANQPTFSLDEKKHVLKKLTQAVGFENFLHTRFPGQKRFSLEGGESLIPALDMVMEHGATLGINEFVIGMAHRGRLNVLANIFNKPYREIFSEFDPKDYEDEFFDGDVKYHLGYDRKLTTDKGHDINLTLAPNPSHLEAVDPVVEGITRAKIDNHHGGDNSKVAPILIHGDAAIAAQGVVYEVIQMAQLDGYKTGGTIHIVINNQVGFTTNYKDGRSSTYCTDVGKVTLSPVFHVNGDDPEALVHTIKMAMEFRQEFKQDVFIDLLCYRKYGHNEGDEPKFTQPLLYKAISKHANPKELYVQQLLSKNEITEDNVKELEETFKAQLTEEFEKAKEIKMALVRPFMQDLWTGTRLSTDSDFDKSPETGVDNKSLNTIANKLTAVPADKKFFRKLQKILKDRSDMIANDKLDWGMVELLAYGSLLTEGHNVRLSGQDVQRGTFSHRHSVVTLEDTSESYCHLNNLTDKQGEFRVYNSLLSEYGVLGFDYGYSLAEPNDLVIWEAQFGDFFNGAQIMIDQFISSAEDKWKIMSGLVMLLPHGYEGMGAEHSSARLERFLTLCAENNMQVVNCTTPANFFHVLRRQLKREFRKPLVVFTPKSLLRHPRCMSSIADLTKGSFQEVIDDSTAKADVVNQVVFCQGKLYYELLAKKEELNANEIAIVRIEQLYPLPQKQLDKIVAKYKNASKHVWVQEEPENMGAWSFLLRNWRSVQLDLVSRPASASPASGSPKRAEKRQKAIIDGVFAKYLNEVNA